jgi:hypothetical protein
MTGDEHYREAERIVSRAADSASTSDTDLATAHALLAAADVLAEILEELRMVRQCVQVISAP